MHSAKTTLRRLPIPKITKLNTKVPLHTTARNMSLFPRFTSEFSSPLIRIMDDYDRAMRTAFNDSGRGGASTLLRSFSPKFDVKELKDAYELHGEFPGIDQKNVNIEWTDGNTLTISGRTENHREEGTRPSAIEDVSSSSTNNGGAEDASKYHKPTVEEESGAQGTAVTKTPSTSTEVQPQSTSDAPKFWVSERSVGEFHRSFSFPTRVDQENVKASLKNGILSVVVPKAKPAQPKKINIE